MSWRAAALLALLGACALLAWATYPVAGPGALPYGAWSWAGGAVACALLVEVLRGRRRR